MESLIFHETLSIAAKASLVLHNGAEEDGDLANGGLGSSRDVIYAWGRSLRNLEKMSCGMEEWIEIVLRGVEEMIMNQNEGTSDSDSLSSTE